MAKQNKPAIRFKGFTDAWEQRKFSDITFPAGEKNKENLPLESYSITNESGFVPQDEKFENGGTMREADKRMYYIVSPNSFAYNPARINVGSIGYQDTGKSVIVSSLYEVFKTSDDVDDRLLWHWFKSPDFQKLIMQLQEGGVRLYFYYDKLCMGQVPLPSLEEQRKIGKLFDTLDHLITLHQRKYDKLQVLKKAMLEKMFPKNGSSVPEIRFKGFTDAWEQRKLGDFCEMFNGDRSAKYPNEQDMVHEGIPFINAGDLENGCVNLLNANKITTEKYNDLGGAKLQLGDIVYCLRGTLGKNAYIDNFSEGTVASSLVAIRPKNIDGKYLFYILNSDIEYSQRILHDEGAAQPNLSAKSVSEFIIPIPNIDEQKKLSSFFDSLSNLITLHQRELEKLQNIKKSMLEKMFV